MSYYGYCPRIKQRIKSHRWTECADTMADWSRTKSAAPGCTRPESGRRE